MMDVYHHVVYAYQLLMKKPFVRPYVDTFIVKNALLKLINVVFVIVLFHHWYHMSRSMLMILCPLRARVPIVHAESTFLTDLTVFPVFPGLTGLTGLAVLTGLTGLTGLT